MPVNAVPVVGGNVVLISGNDGPEMRVLTEQERLRRLDEGEKLYVAHFSTCPNSNAHRRTR